VLIDPNSTSPDHNVSVDILDVTPDGALLAYAVRHGGEDEHEALIQRLKISEIIFAGMFFSVCAPPILLVHDASLATTVLSFTS